MLSAEESSNNVTDLKSRIADGTEKWGRMMELNW